VVHSRDDKEVSVAHEVKLWLWVCEGVIMIIAHHVPGVSNKIADSESRLEGDKSDGMLSHSVFLKINQLMDPLEVDVLSSRLTHQLPRFFSW